MRAIAGIVFLLAFSVVIAPARAGDEAAEQKEIALKVKGWSCDG